jgi:hypothetical protein
VTPAAGILHRQMQLSQLKGSKLNPKKLRMASACLLRGVSYYVYGLMQSGAPTESSFYMLAKHAVKYIQNTI